MQQRDKIRLEHILETIQLLEKATQGKTFEDFMDDFVLRAAVERFLIIIGEAVGQLSEDVKITNENWAKIKAFRNLVIHEYFRVSPIETWEIVENHLSDVKRWVLKFDIDKNEV